MKVLQINSVYPVKSTGKIVYEIAEIQKKHGIEPYIVCGESKVQAQNVYAMKSGLYLKLNILKTRLFGKHGFYSKSATKNMLRWVDEVRPDIIHLHNIHGHYLNIKLLFEYILKNNIPVVWTLHDCWAFTGHCSHFDFAGCEKWKTGCHNCELKKDYPVSWFFDRSKESYKDKKRLFTSVEKSHVTTPSRWLKDLCERSFLGKYPVTVVNNGVDLAQFAPTPSDLRKSLGLEDKFVILGIVDSLNSMKGGQYLLELAEMLEEDECIVLLTLKDNVGEVPKNIRLISKTVSAKKLAEIYTMADVFVNPSLQETFSMINLEAIACGTPVVTFNSGGGTEAQSEKTGVVVPRTDVKAMYEGIKRVKNGEFCSEDCVQRAQEFDCELKFEKYIDIYKDILDK